MPSADITKRILADAIKQVMAQKPLVKINIGDITTACGISRNTFYYHFKDKYDLVNWVFSTEIMAQLDAGADLDDTPNGALLRICTYLYDNRAFYRNALSVTGQNSFIEFFSDAITAAVKTATQDLYLEDEDQAFFATFFSDAITASVVRWLMESEPIPPERYTRLIQRAITGGQALAGQQDGPNAAKPEQA